MHFCTARYQETRSRERTCSLELVEHVDVCLGDRNLHRIECHDRTHNKNCCCGNRKRFQSATFQSAHYCTAATKLGIRQGIRWHAGIGMRNARRTRKCPSSACQVRRYQPFNLARFISDSSKVQLTHSIVVLSKRLGHTMHRAAHTDTQALPADTRATASVCACGRSSFYHQSHIIPKNNQSSGGGEEGVVRGVGQERLGPSYCFIPGPLVSGLLNSPNIVEYVTSPKVYEV